MFSDLIAHTQLFSYYNDYIYVILMMTGLWAMIAKNNFMKKLIGMTIFQTSIILFYVSIGAKKGASIPILEHGHGDSHGGHDTHAAAYDAHGSHAADLAHGGHHEALVDVMAYANPLPHVLMLTAIVVGVATLGLALSVLIKINREYGSIEEDEIIEKVV